MYMCSADIDDSLVYTKIIFIVDFVLFCSVILMLAMIDAVKFVSIEKQFSLIDI